MRKESCILPIKITPPFAWVGGKRRLSKVIVEKMPSHNSYVEVFAGALSVLYAKPKIKGCIEIINDLDSDLINLHRIIQTQPQILRAVLDKMFISRQIFEGIKKGFYIPKNNIERAAFYYYLISLSFGSKRTHFAMPKSRKNGAVYRDFKIYSERLKGVYIENMDFRKVIKQYDKTNSLFYVDPPYVGTEGHYKNKEVFTIKEHEDLRNLLSLIQGKFILSYNDCELVREFYRGFRVETQEVGYTLAAHDNRKKTKEVLITNF